MFSDAKDRRSQDNCCKSINSDTNTSMTEFINGNESPNMTDVDLSEHNAHNESPIKFKGPKEIYK